MAHKGDWLPGRREDQILMAGNWLKLMAARADTWPVPPAEKGALAGLLEAADAAFRQANGAERTAAVTKACELAFAALAEKMRFVKSRYLLSPPLTGDDLVALGLRPKDRTRTPAPPPSAQAEADVSWPGVHMIELRLRPVKGSGDDASLAGCGFRVYYGVLGRGEGAERPVMRRELAARPESGDDLPHSVFTRRKKERFDFDAADSGKTAWFCVRYENAKGKPGPWGPLFSAVIP